MLYRETHVLLEELADATLEATREIAMRRLTRRLLKLRDDERRRLARELHDTTAQNFAALAMNLTLVNPGSDPASADCTS